MLSSPGTLRAHWPALLQVCTLSCLPPSPSPCVPVFQDPPAFTVRPKEEYFQEVGRELVIPCAAHGDPPPTVTWLKVGAAALGNQLRPPGRWMLLLASGASL